MRHALRAALGVTAAAGVVGMARQRREVMLVRAGALPRTTPTSPIVVAREDRLAGAIARWQPAPPRGLAARAAAALWAGPLTIAGMVMGVAGRGRPRWDALHACLVFEEVGTPVASLLQAVGADANAVGQVVLSRRAVTSPTLLAHEAAHVRQAERLGPSLVTAYVLLAARYGYRAHPLERAARRAAMRWSALQVRLDPPREGVPDTLHG